MYHYPIRIGISHVGIDELLSPVSAIELMQDCSMLWMESEPQMLEWTSSNHIAMMIGSRQVDFARRPKHGERLDVVTSIYDFKGPLGYRNTLIRDEAGELVASSWAIGPFVSLDTGKMVRIPQEVLDEITFDPKFDMEYLPKKIKLPAVEPNELEPFETRYTDIDLNMHVNNVQYVRMAYDCLPDGQLDFKRLRIEYKGQARFGQTIHPIMYRDDERTIVVLNNDEGAPYTLVEFS